jgi:hypothetical protein
MPEPYRVFVVLDREYGIKLFELAPRGPVWIVDTPANRDAVKTVWATNPAENHLTGVTIFKSDAIGEDVLIEQLNTIDLHHGHYSANPPYTQIEVMGVRFSERLRAELSDFGFDDFAETADGFRASRPLPVPD